MKTPLTATRFGAMMSAAVLAALPAAVLAGDDFSKPVITTEIRKDEKGKDVLYMFIDGVKVHETDVTKDPLPPVVTPGEGAGFAAPPSDAIVLFDGSEESFRKNWTDTKGNPSQWKIVDGALESVKRAGYIQTKQNFGSCQLHIEWAAPAQVKGEGQGRGNSGVFLMGQYEVQVLDSYENQTYPDGQAGALYGRSKPLVNASRKPGEWQSYDIIFQRPIFGEDGKVVRRAMFTVLHNGVVIQDHQILSGGTGWMGPHAVSEYKAHPDKLPISLQDHGNPVRYRNVWIRELPDKPL
ncbi:MAG: 3-keto-disaccharide hydrolase [Luteolibacter sp.]